MRKWWNAILPLIRYSLILVGGLFTSSVLLEHPSPLTLYRPRNPPTPEGRPSISGASLWELRKYLIQFVSPEFLDCRV
jgi:hypothetical protein